MNKSKRPLLSDVARDAGVSMVTVSRVLHNTGPVSTELRQRVETSLAALGYTPRASAKPASGGTIAVLTGDLLNPFFPEIIRGIQEEADNYGLILTLYNLTDNAHRQQQLLQKLGRLSIDGVVLMGTSLFTELLSWREQHKVPFVVLNRRIQQPGVHSILVDNEAAFYRAAQHLLGFHHTRIGYLAPSRNSDVIRARRQGLEAALRDAGLSMRPEWSPVVPPGGHSAGGFQAMQRLLELPAADRPTGVMTFNDLVAIGALHAVRMHRLSVPKDISVIGVDDISAAAYAFPPLTTIALPKYQMGKLAVQTLNEMRDGEMATVGECTVLESPLIVRESTGPAPDFSQ